MAGKGNITKVIDLELLVREGAGSLSRVEALRQALAQVIQMTGKKIGLDIDTSKLRSFEQMQEIFNQYGSSLRIANNQIQLMMHNSQGLEAKTQAILGKYQQLRTSGGQFASGYGIPISQMETMLKLSPQVTSAEKQTAEGMREMGEAATQTGSRLNSLRAIMQNIFIYGLGYRALYEIIDAFKQTITISKELNEAMTDLRIATGKNRQEAEAMISTYNELAQQIGATTKEVVDSSVTWLRQGYSEADTNKLVYDSMVLSKVGMLESAEATEYLTSAMKGYKVEVDDAMGIIDKLTKIDLNAAVSSGELAEAMSKTANSARLAGVSMNELLGYIATVAEVTQQSAATVGTSFKSIFSRFSKISAGSFVDEETGEDLKIWVAAA